MFYIVNLFLIIEFKVYKFIDKPKSVIHYRVADFLAKLCRGLAGALGIINAGGMTELDQVAGFCNVSGAQVQIDGPTFEFSTVQIQELDVADLLVVRDMGSFYLHNVRIDVHHNGGLGNVAVSDQAPFRLQIAGHFKPLDVCHRYVLQTKVLTYVIEGVVVAAVAVQEEKMCESVGDQAVTDFLYILSQSGLGDGHGSGEMELKEIKRYVKKHWETAMVPAKSAW